MRGLIALPKHFVRNSPDAVQCFAQLLECVRVLASLFAAGLDYSEIGKGS
jgi:hypothetical protein